MILQGLRDEIHTVVKQSLVSLEKICSVLLDHRTDWFYKGDICMQPILCDDTPLIESACIESPIQLLQHVFDKLALVFENRYWIVQNKYCHFVATINYNALEQIFGRDKAMVYKV